MSPGNIVVLLEMSLPRPFRKKHWGPCSRAGFPYDTGCSSDELLLHYSVRGGKSHRNSLPVAICSQSARKENLFHSCRVLDVIWNRARPTFVNNGWQCGTSARRQVEIKQLESENFKWVCAPCRQQFWFFLLCLRKEFLKCVELSCEALYYFWRSRRRCARWFSKNIHVYDSVWVVNWLSGA